MQFEKTGLIYAQPLEFGKHVWSVTVHNDKFFGGESCEGSLKIGILEKNDLRKGLSPLGTSVV